MHFPNQPSISDSDKYFARKRQASKEKRRRTKKKKKGKYIIQLCPTELIQLKMVVRIRLSRFGNKHQPFYNIIVSQARYVLSPL